MRNITAPLATGAALLLLAAALIGHQAYAQSTSDGYTGQAGPALVSLRTAEDMTIGSSGQTVANLQGLLIELGYLQVSPEVPLGYFGTLTADALAKFQQELGVPNTGYFGPMTKTALTSWVARSDNPLQLANQYPTAGSSTQNTGAGASSEARPQGATGYWYQGNWYNSIPLSTTTASNINGYWLNGTWYPRNGNSQPELPSSMTNGSGYWYNGTWYQSSSTSQTSSQSGSQGNQASTTSYQSMLGENISGSLVDRTSTPMGQTGYWYQGDWRSSLPDNPSSQGIGEYWLNGVHYLNGNQVP